ncbi:acid phosphatase AphA [Dickeya dadantii]|uniref:phosphatidylglycerophosphatase C n=1 Tax=Dickeya dadantii TaxID=204038 RepID=UPI0020A64CB1|nr:phosphatidylglycerophosphatase C [Dickeya dadantii]NPE51072.1 acid phosphatase AphA [Dickeya dadantii]
MLNASPTAMRVVFFDLDGTLHRQDLFGCFLWFLIRHLPLNVLLIVPLLPLLAAGLAINGRSARWPVSLLLWAITAGRRESRLRQLEQAFVVWFRQRVTPFPLVHQRLERYLADNRSQVWLVTGSPQRLVEQVYGDAPFLPRVQLIGSQMTRRWGGWVLSLRCLGHEKVVQMERRLGAPLELYSGYSDSQQDNPLLFFCAQRWRVTPAGHLQLLE